MYYVYFKSYDWGVIFQVTEWNEEVKQALLFANNMDEHDLKFVFNDEPIFIQQYAMGDVEELIESLQLDIEYIYDDWEIEVAKDVIKTLKRVSFTD